MQYGLSLLKCCIASKHHFSFLLVFVFDDLPKKILKLVFNGCLIFLHLTIFFENFRSLWIWNVIWRCADQESFNPFPDILNVVIATNIRSLISKVFFHAFYVFLIIFDLEFYCYQFLSFKLCIFLLFSPRFFRRYSCSH